MKRIYRNLLVLLILLPFNPNRTHAEGSNEIYVDKPNANTMLYLCNDFDGQCGGTSGIRTQFAIYDCNETDRLYFAVQDPDELVYMGFNGNPNGSWWNDYKIVYRIRNMAGDIVQDEMDLPTSGAGFINDISEAREGPEQLVGSAGYDAHIFTPPEPGTYYLEFDRIDNETGERAEGDFYIELFDVTIANAITSVIETGRLYSKGWQFREESDFGGFKRNSSTFYIYSNDSIITSVEFDDMEGRAWIMFCNQTGCGNTGDFVEDRKSLDNEQAYVPEYPIFVNPPDPDLFPPATTLGEIIEPDPWGETSCSNGSITFHVNVDKAGNVDILLDFDDPYVDRTLSAIVNTGENLIVWDGNDGAGTPVPNNTNIDFSVTYINGLTNLPLYDIEGNENGFRILLISPTGPTPLVYWDDSNILSNSGVPIGTTNFTGCLSTPPEPGCHSWTTANNSEYGDLNTINTWWYTASTSTAPVQIIEERGADSLIFDQTPPQNHCAGTTGLPFSVEPDPNTDEYHWSYTGNDATINHADPSDNFITISFGPNATSGNIEVYGTNTNCPDPGPVSPLAITIEPLPEPAISVSPNDTVCTNETVSFTGIENSGLTISSWEWDFGDGTTASTQNATHTYTAPMADTVRLIVVSDQGCTDTAFMPIWVVDVSIDFTMSPSPSCAGYEVTFTGIGDADFTTWDWDFGDGSTGTGQILTHTYAVADTYNIQLSVCSEQATHQLTVHPPPTAFAGGDTATCEDVFFDLSMANPPPSAVDHSSVFWSGGLGSFDDPTALAPVYTPAPGELGVVQLQMVAYGIAPCYNDTSYMDLEVIEGAYAFAGSD
ncbi:MAG: PKD domain-containing protein, partial [Bacteroidales bacterium]